MVPSESLGTVSYSHSIVTVVLCSVLYYFRDKMRYWPKIAILFIPPSFDAPILEAPSEYCHTVFLQKKLEWCGYRR